MLKLHGVAFLSTFLILTSHADAQTHRYDGSESGSGRGQIGGSYGKAMQQATPPSGHTIGGLTITTTVDDVVVPAEPGEEQKKFESAKPADGLVKNVPGVGR